MAAKCYNTNDPGFQDLMRVYNNYYIVSNIVDQFQARTKSDGFPTTIQAAAIVRDMQAVPTVGMEDPVKAIENNLIKLGYAHRLNGQLMITQSPKNSRYTMNSVRKQNLNSAINYLHAFRIMPGMYEVVNYKNAVGIRINPTKVKDYVPANPAQNNLSLILNHLNKTIPNVSIQLVSVKEAKAIHDKIADWQKTDVDFDRVKSFYHNGTAYLIKGRVTDEIGVEEVLHPLVSAIRLENPELFNKLVNDGMVLFPALVQQIKDAYYGLRNFDETDMQVEFVSQILSRAAAGKFEKEGVDKTILDYINLFVDWFVQKIKEIADTFANAYDIDTDAKTATIKVKDLKSDLSYSKLAQAILTQGLVFDVDVSLDEKVRYNIQEDLRPYVKQQYDSATREQQEVLDAILYENPTQVDLMPGHIYLDQDGNEYISVTTKMKGKLSEEKEALNSMNLFFGNQVDSIVESMIAGKSFDEAMQEADKILEKTNKRREDLGLKPLTADQGLTRDQMEKVYDDIKAILDSEDQFQPGAIFIPQMIVSSPLQTYDKDDNLEYYGVAGSIDLLVINPDGTAEVIDIKASKNSVLFADGKLTDNYTKGYKQTGGIADGQTLSTQAQHGIQIGTYAAMLFALGVNVTRTRTIHVKLDVTGKEDLQSVNDLRVEGVVEHAINGNKANIAKIVNVPNNTRTIGENPLPGSEETKTESEARKEAAQDAKENPDNPALITALGEIIGDLELRRTQLERMLSEGKGFRGPKGRKTRETSILKLTILINAVREDVESYAMLNGTQLNAAVGRLVDFAMNDLSEFERYVQDPENINSPVFSSIILGYSKFLETYAGIEALGIKVNTTNQQRLLALKEKMANASRILDDAFIDFAAAFVTNTTLNKDLTEEDIRKMLAKTTDISLVSMAGESMGCSEDTLLSLIGKIYKAQKAKLLYDNESFAAEAREQGNALIAASRAAGIADADAYLFMFSKNADGKLNGRYVQKIGNGYWNYLYNLRAATRDEKGEPAKYIKTDNLKGKELDEAVAHNKKLYEAKKAYGRFRSAEDYDETGVIDGAYHRYSKEFKNARAMYSEYSGGRWRAKSGITSDQYAAYMNKYFRQAPPYLKPILSKKGEFTGAVEEVRGRYFVRNEYIEIRDDVTLPDGTSTVDSEYNTIMNPTDALGMARKAYYEWWVNEHENGSIGKLPRDIESSLVGKIPRIQKSFFNKIKDMDEGRGSAVLKAVGKFVNVFKLRTKVYPKVYVTDEAGDLIRTPPMFYNSDLKSDYRIEKLKEQIAELEEKHNNKQVGIKEYLAESKKLNSMLTAEEERVSPDDINTDMTQNMIAYRTMASNFEAMNAIEDTILAVKKVIDEREYVPAGGELSQKITAKGREMLTKSGEKSLSNVQSRLNNWLDMTFYNEGAFEKSVAEQVMSTVLKYTSLNYVAFNPFSALNNIVFGRVSNAIETAGGQFYDRRSMLRATKEANIALAGFVAGLGSKAAMMSGNTKYKDYKPQTKYEALAKYFKMIRKYESGEGRQGIPDVLSFGYWMQEGGEYLIQSKTGMALIMSEQVTNPSTGETMSVYDALDYDAATGNITVKDGFEFDNDKRAEMTRQIWGMNEYIHGNYAEEDKAVIQRWALGQLAMQFHKWVIPSFKARFKKGSFDERFGVYTEGRYRTVWNMLGYIWGAHGSIKERYKVANGALSETEMANVYKVLAEIGFLLTAIATYAIFAGLRDGTDDDDRELKRLLGALQQQSDRTQSEILTFVDPREYARILKNPIASSRSIGEFAEALVYSADYFFTPDSEDKYYVRGPRKGDPKVIKQWEDATPILRSIKKWKSLDTVETWYVKD